jgi:hypothetical protein
MSCSSVEVHHCSAYHMLHAGFSLVLPTLQPWWWRQYIPQKRHSTCTGLYFVTCQIVLFTTTVFIEIFIQYFDKDFDTPVSPVLFLEKLIGFLYDKGFICTNEMLSFDNGFRNSRTDPSLIVLNTVLLQSVLIASYFMHILYKWCCNHC